MTGPGGSGPTSGSSGAGAGVYYDSAGQTLPIANCTFVNNEVSAGPGVRPDSGAIGTAGDTVEVYNSIAWGNLPAQFEFGGASSVAYSDIQGGWTGTGNTNSDPLFVDADGADNDPNTLDDNDYHLAAGSPAIDAGNNAAVPADTYDLDGDSDPNEPLPYDLDGDPRFVDDPNVADTGAGAPPLVDMGAYEGPDEPCAHGVDCNSNGVDDSCDIASDPNLDCNGNRVIDACDLSNGTSDDCNGNGTPDECDIADDPNLDCNGNGVIDACDLSNGTSDDCNGNGTPDECDIADDPNLDCNGNGTLDECDLASGASPDCNGNGIPDECDISEGGSADCNGNGLPDECETDCNHDGIADACQLDVFGPFDGYVVSFGGVDDFARVPDAPELNFGANDAITIEAWVYQGDTSTSRRAIISKNRDLDQNYFMSISSGHLEFGYRSADDSESYVNRSDTTAFAGSGEWVHVAVAHVFATGTVDMYVDGLPVASNWLVAPAMGPLQDAFLLFVGAQRVSSGAGTRDELAGALDEVRIWNVVRAPSNIQTYMSQHLTGGESGLVAYWRMDEGTGDFAFDLAGTNDMELRNGAAWLAIDACDCPGDVQDDGDVDLTDLAILLANFDTAVPVYQNGDLNGDSFVDLADLTLLLANFDSTCQ